MQLSCIVEDTSLFHDLLGLPEALEYLPVQQFVPWLAAAGLTVAVLPG